MSSAGVDKIGRNQRMTKKKRARKETRYLLLLTCAVEMHLAASSSCTVVRTDTLIQTRRQPGEGCKGSCRSHTNTPQSDASAECDRDKDRDIPGIVCKSASMDGSRDKQLQNPTKRVCSPNSLKSAPHRPCSRASLAYFLASRLSGSGSTALWPWAGPRENFRPTVWISAVRG